MVESIDRTRWLVALVNRRSARLLAGHPKRLREQERLEGGWRGESEPGGWSQANYERSVEKDATDHLRNVAEAVERRWHGEGFDRVALGGPHEVVVRLEAMLSDEVRGRLAPKHVDVDLASATETQIGEVLARLVVEDEERTEREALDRLTAGVGSRGRGVEGLEATLDALNERRVGTLVLAPDFDGSGHRCPACGLLLADGAHRCPADGTATGEPVQLREAVVESAIVQDADVVVLRHLSENAPRQGIGAVLRF
jgi:peptide chain release factor subunit 1